MRLLEVEKTIEIPESVDAKIDEKTVTITGEIQHHNDEAQWAAQPCQRSVLRLGEVGVAVVALVKFTLDRKN